MEKGTKYYVSDFETSAKTEDLKSAFVYATGLMDIEDNQSKMIYHNNIKDYVDYIFKLPTSTSIIYFHNLSFDITFLLDYFVNELGFKQILPNFEEKEGKKVKKYSKKNIDKSFDMVFANGTFYQLTLNIGEENYKTPTGRTSKKTTMRKIIFRDTYKLVAFPLKKVAKDFLGYNMPKDGIDHDIIRNEGYKLNESEYYYLYDDVKVLKDFCKLAIFEGVKVDESFNVKFDKITIASQSLEQYKKFLLDDFLNNKKEIMNSLTKAKNTEVNLFNTKKRKNEDVDKEELYKKLKNELFSLLFPTLRHETDCFLRNSYYGGLVYKNSKVINKHDKLFGLVYDVNSLYPSVMRKCLLPFGYPCYYKGKYENSNLNKKEYPLYIQRIKVYKFELKEGFIPNIQIRDTTKFKFSEYQENNIYIDSKGNKKYYPCEFTFTNVQLERFLKSYEVTGIEYIEGYGFQATYGLFDTYIDVFMDMKKHGKGATRSTAKLFLNSLYGKFGTNPQREERIIEYEDGIFSTTNILEGETTNYLSEGIYIPIATFITSYAREVLLNAIEKVHDRFLYADTDSIHILGYEIPNIEIHDKNIGAWKHEGKFVNAKYIGAKRYAELMIQLKENKEKGFYDINFKWEIKCCGLSRDIMEKISIDVFDVFKGTNKDIENYYTKKDDIYYYHDKECNKKVVGLVRSKKKKNVKGGLLIIEQPYKINDNLIFRY